MQQTHFFSSLVDAVDNRILTLRHQSPLDHSLFVKCDGADGHVSRFFHVAGRRIDDGQIVLLVSLAVSSIMLMSDCNPIVDQVVLTWTQP